MGRFDVTARLAEGRPAVQHTQNYVWACHVLGYQHPDLTAHSCQVQDWYDSEHGLDLTALGDDCTKLWAAVHAIEEALAIQRGQLAELAAVWAGDGAGSAINFLEQHCNSGMVLAGVVHAAARRCAALRDDLWQLVDAKAAAATAIDDRRLTERPAWLSAAALVTTGSPGRAAAAELIEQQVKPYVDTDIRIDWLTAMRSTTASVEAAYQAVIDALTPAPAARFESPGQFALGAQPLGEPAAPIAPVGFAPAAAGPSGGSDVLAPEATECPPPDASPCMPSYPTASTNPVPPASPSRAPDGLAPLPPLPGLDAPPWDAASLPLGDVGDLGGLGGGGVGGGAGLGGLVGLAGRIIDAIGGLVGSVTDGLGDASAPDAPLDAGNALGESDDRADQQTGDPAGLDGSDDQETDQADDGDADNAENGETTPDMGKDASPDDAAAPVAEEVTPAPSDPLPAGEVPPARPAPQPTPPPAPPPEGSTPCEIAADELPQAGQ